MRTAFVCLALLLAIPTAASGLAPGPQSAQYSVQPSDSDRVFLRVDEPGNVRITLRADLGAFRDLTLSIPLDCDPIVMTSVAHTGTIGSASSSRTCPAQPGYYEMIVSVGVGQANGAVTVTGASVYAME